MAGPIQKDRIYSLIVGTEDDAIEINNLQIKFKVEKASNNKDKKNTAYVEIYNLSEDRRTKLEKDYVQVQLSVGYAHTELVHLFSGQVKNITTSKLENFLTKRQGTDLVTRLELDELYTEINNSSITGFVPSGSNIRAVIERVIKDIPEVTQRQITGRNVETVLPSGYPLTGTPRQILDRLSHNYDIDWQIDQGILYVADSDGVYSEDKSKVYSIGQNSGLIERPEYINEEAKRLRRAQRGKDGSKNKKEPKKNAIRLKILLNPRIVAGSMIYLDFHPQTGYYKVDEVVHEGDFRGNTWYSVLRCTERIE